MNRTSVDPPHELVSTRYITSLIGIASSFILLSGCATIRMPERPGVRTETTGCLWWKTEIQVPTGFVSRDAATAYGTGVAEVFDNRASALGNGRATLNSLVIGVAASAVGMAATGGAAVPIAALGLAGAGTAAIGQQWIIPAHALIYSRGAQAVLCVVDKAKRQPAPSDPVASVAGAIDELNKRLADLGQAIDTSQGLSPADRQKAEEYYAQARAFSASALESVGYSDPLGGVVVTTVDQIRANVEYEIAKSEPDTLSFNETLKNNLRSSAGIGGGEQPTVPPVSPPPSLSTPNKAAQALGETPQDVVTDAMNKVAVALSVVKASVTVLKGPSVPPADLFTGCAIGDLGAKPLTISPATMSLAASTSYQVQAFVSGGTSPYSVTPNTVPAKVTATIDNTTSIGDAKILSVTIDSSAATTTSTIVVNVTDSSGAGKTLVISFK